MGEGNYSLSERWLHRLALGSPVIREMTFDLECALSKDSGPDQTDQPHVFVSGLARAGTSIILRTLYRQGCFATLTYRDMPFVLAPGLWRRLSRWNRREAVLQERVHGDGLDVSFDSPEAFEEVFWLTFCRRAYVRDAYLTAHVASEETIKRFRRFVAHVVAANGDAQSWRYLSKNNNNLLRLESLRRAFPSCTILIPFRRPYEHASSLHGQHQRFRAMHLGDRFAAEYMSWLGHHEFGGDQRPFVFSDQANPTLPDSPDSINFWMAYWISVYESVLQRIGNDVILFDYDSLCESPQPVLEGLARCIQLEPKKMASFAGKISPPKPYDRDAGLDADVLAKAEELHARLTRASHDCAVDS